MRQREALASGMQRAGAAFCLNVILAFDDNALEAEQPRQAALPEREALVLELAGARLGLSEAGRSMYETRARSGC